MDAVVYRLGEALDVCRTQLSAVDREYGRAVRRAEAKRNARRRAVLTQWAAARRRATRVTGVRRGIWREHRAMDDGKLRERLDAHEEQLRRIRVFPEYRQARHAPGLAGELWYARMIRSEMRRRSGQPYPCRVAGCTHTHRVPRSSLILVFPREEVRDELGIQAGPVADDATGTAGAAAAG